MNSTFYPPLARSDFDPDPSGGKQSSGLKQLGPSLITGAADDDPSGIAISARIWHVTAYGPATNMAKAPCRRTRSAGRKR
ncbi:hypothetical protein QO002_004286 [Pararhizobium capsulatum DSM 1112]|uniref:Uncharacterized protein n=1 Tax=Pararhizobium capsulatum DSM 1112 TaxID=1121113 RepID=A0ABU0BV21_9HYPH|nr:hypothetical protein [Pararhizobium capsulatum DSM 1112]